MSTHTPAAPAVPTPARAAGCQPEPAAVMTVVTCRCGTDLDGYSEAAAWQSFEDHLGEHEVSDEQH